MTPNEVFFLWVISVLISGVLVGAVVGGLQRVAKALERIAKALETRETPDGER